RRECIRIVCVLLYRFVLFFFFSSRRRHTRSKRDWSSDVCSSDLTATGALAVQVGGDIYNNVFFKSVHNGSQNPAVDTIPAGAARSEERRVGKECRSRWWGEQ